MLNVTEEESIAAYNRELEEAEAEFKRGEVTTQAELKKEIENW